VTDPPVEPSDPPPEHSAPLVDPSDPPPEHSAPLVEPVETPPLLRVVKGDPTAQELAALVAVVASLAGPAAPAARRTPVWNAPARLQRRVLRHGPGAWRSSGLPPA
jgi:hypothetical protein